MISGSFTSMASAVTDPVTINEIDCHGNDWIEVTNTSTKSVNISGWMLSDHAPNAAKASHRYIFPAGSTLTSKGYKVVQQSGVGALQLPFGVPCAGGQNVYLSKPGIGALFTVVDKVVVPVIQPHLSYGRVPNGTGQFEFTLGTKSAANNSAMPTLISATTIKCTKSKSCSVTLKGKNTATYQLVKQVSGVTLSATGVLKSLVSKPGTKAIQVKLVGTYGSTVATLSIVTK